MKKISIIPKPTSIEIKPDHLSLKKIKGIMIIENSKELINIANVFRKFLSPISNLEILPWDKNSNKYLKIIIEKKTKIKKGEYSLIIDAETGITLQASTEEGLYYGFQTFRQLAPIELEKKQNNDGIIIQNCSIKDTPKFQYRGMHLDVSRHFFNVDFIKTYIDMIALHKMNFFHWHLTDDNGWRIEIEQYPELSKKSAYRVDRENQPWRDWNPILPEEKPTYGGFYSKKEIKEIVEYASERHITIIPEIEMPAHTSAVFAAYPEYSCKGETLNVVPGSYWPTIDIFCAGSDSVFSFLENILTEIIELFPGKYIHIGGDEADKTYWEKCAKCQKRIKEENLKSEEELQSYFIKRIEKFIVRKNKKLVGWDEILEGGLAPSATVMSWRGISGGIEAAKAGHNVIMCPTTHCYFDYYQTKKNQSKEPAFDGYIPLEKVYSFNPIPKELSNEQSKYILGGQGNLWTEFVKTPERAQHMVLPRMTALSEVLWTGSDTNTYKDFYKRLQYLKERYKILNWNHAPI